MCEHEAVGGLRQAVGQQAVEEALGIGAGDLVLREAREVEHADALLHGPDLRGDHLEDVVARPAAVFLATIQGEPLRPLPAEGLAEDRTLRG